MAKTQDIKRRIRSIQNTRQLTKAMKMVSAAKLRRATDAVVQARPYSNQLRKVVRSLAGRVSSDAHPLLAQRDERNVEVVVVSGDKGLCGGFNTQIIKTASRFIDGLDARDVQLSFIGKKARDFFRRHGVEARAAWVDVFRNVEFSLAQEIADSVIEPFSAGDLDAVYVVYNEFKSAIAQKPVVERVLPIEPVAAADDASASEDYIYEPGPQQLFDALLPHSVRIQLFHVMLESCAAEHAARMTAMDSATRNAGELIERLTLHMNRVRQASITTEIIEVVSGAEALG